MEQNFLNEVFLTILHELSIGYLSDKKLPFISLNFNKESLLYSIMDEKAYISRVCFILPAALFPPIAEDPILPQNSISIV